MKIFFTLAMTFVMVCCAYAQTGIFMTYTDFKAGNLMKADDGKIAVKTMKHQISMKSGGQTKEMQTSEFFAMERDGKLYRFPQEAIGNLACELIMVTNDYAVWRYTESRSEMGRPSRTTAIDELTKGLDGTMLDITMSSQLKKMEEMKEMKPLYDCVKASGKLTLFHPLVMAVGKCMSDDPTYKKDPSEVIPKKE